MKSAVINRIVWLSLMLLGFNSNCIADDFFEKAFYSDQSNTVKGNNIIRIAPVSVVDDAAGISLGIERLLGKKKKIGIHLPGHLLFHREVVTGIVSQSSTYSNYLYLTPGIKYYPKGQKRLSYAIGPNFVFGYNNNSTTEISRNDIQVIGVDDISVSRYRMGAVISNYVNFQLSKVVSLGLDGGVGIKFFDRIYYKREGVYNANVSYENKADLLGQFSVHLAFRF